MKRNCNDCKALETNFEPYCSLGFKIQGCKKYENITVSWKPLEECPKPKTHSDYSYYYNLKSQGKII